MKYCKKCLYPNTKPQLVFDQDGICSACINYELKKEIDWEFSSARAYDNPKNKKLINREVALKYIDF